MRTAVCKIPLENKDFEDKDITFNCCVKKGLSGSDLIILDKQQIKKLEDENNTAYENIAEIMRKSVEPDKLIDELILNIAANLNKIFVGNGHAWMLENICSIIQRNLEIRSLSHLCTRAYRLLPREYKQIYRDHSTSRLLAHDNKFPHQTENYLKEQKEKIKSVWNSDWDHMRRQDIQELQALVADFDIHMRNVCTDKEITIVDADDTAMTRSAKKTVQHLRYLPRKSSKLLDLYAATLEQRAKAILQFRDVVLKFPPPDDLIKVGIKAERMWIRLYKPWVDAKHHLDWIGWYRVYKLLKDYNINKVADLTSITDDNGLPRGMTREAIQNWLQAKGPDFFIDFMKHAPGIFEISQWYQGTLAAKYGFTNRMWGKVKVLVSRK